MNDHRWMAVVLSLALVFGLFAGCGEEERADLSGSLKQPREATLAAPATTPDPTEAAPAQEASTLPQEKGDSAEKQSKASLLESVPKTETPDAPAPETPPTETAPTAPAETPPEPITAPQNMGRADPDLERLAGLWKLYSYEVEGAPGLAEADGVTGWITFHGDGTADYGDGGPMGQTPDTWPDYLGLPVERDGQGLLFFQVPFRDMGPATFTVTDIGQNEITVSGQWTNPGDGTPGGNTCVYRLVEAETPDFLGRPLTQQELAALTDGLDYSEIGFYVCAYDRPEEIDWHEVFYTGAGLCKDLPEGFLKAVESIFGGELYMSVTAVPRTQMMDFVLRKTGVSYEAARKPLTWDYMSEFDYFFHLHGDTNAQMITFSGGYRNGKLFTLYYTRSDWENWIDSRPFVMKAVYDADDGWRYISNLPGDAPAPVTLLDIRYCATREDAAAWGATRFVEVPPLSSDQPDGWCWAVISAREDGVRYILDRADPSVNYEEWQIRAPGEYLDSGVLRQGESFAVHVGQPWVPDVAITATLGNAWGQFCFGEDNWLHMSSEIPRYVTGHDLKGEGRGAAPADQSQLFRFLSDGDWLYRDPATGAAVATLHFQDYRELRVNTASLGLTFSFDYDHYDARPTEAPDLLVLHKGIDNEEPWDQIPAALVASPGDYQLYYAQMDGEQILYLNQQSEGQGVLDLLLPGGEAGSYCFVRYRGTEVTEGQGG